MAKQTFTTGQVLTAAQMTSLQQTAMLGGAASAKTASYTLVAADAGTAISMSNASATTITVNAALFADGDTIQITNIGAGVCTITAGTATVNTASSLALAQWESGTLDFRSASAAVFIKGAGAAAGGGMTLLSTTTLSGATTTISSISQAYTDLYVAIYGMTFDVDGYARIYLRETLTNQNITQIINYDTDAGATTANSTRILPVGFNGQKAAQTGNNIGLQIRNYTEAVANYRNFTWAGYHNYSDGGATVKAFHGGGGVLGSSAINALHFEAAGGATSFSSGTVKIWGIK